MVTSFWNDDVVFDGVASTLLMSSLPRFWILPGKTDVTLYLCDDDGFSRCVEAKIIMRSVKPLQNRGTVMGTNGSFIVLWLYAKFFHKRSV